MSGTPVVNAPTITISAGGQQVLTPVWKNTEGEEVELGQSDPFGKQVTWKATPTGIIDLEPNSDGTEARAIAVGLGSCTVVATATSGLVSAEMHINVVSDSVTEGEIKAE